MFFYTKINSNTIKVISIINNKTQTFYQVLKYMKFSPLLFHNELKQTVRETGFDAIYIEFPPLTHLQEMFEFVIINVPEMARISPNSGSFKINNTGNCYPILVTQSLSQDSLLIVPDINSRNDYADIYRFLDPQNLKNSDNIVISEFWTTTSNKITEQLNEKKKIWISTSGRLVHWFHLRISESPKYYNHQPYML